MSRWIIVLLVTTWSASARAQHVPLPPVNLGDSSFEDAISGPGLLIHQMATVRHAPRFAGPDGERLPGDHSLSAFVLLSHVAFALPRRFLGGYWGADALLPLVHVKVRHDDVSESATGLGDVVLNPIVVSWPDTERVFYQRLSLGVVLPTGKYDPGATVNVGNNVVSFNPYYALTIRVRERFETSWRFHYLWSSSNDAPDARYNAREVRSGQAVHLNGAASVAVSPTMRVGLAGYFLTQLTDSLVDGVAVPHSRERVVGVGPGLSLSVGTFNLKANAYRDLAVENRPAGMQVGVSIQNVWPAPPRER